MLCVERERVDAEDDGRETEREREVMVMEVSKMNENNFKNGPQT